MADRNTAKNQAPERLKGILKTPSRSFAPPSDSTPPSSTELDQEAIDRATKIYNDIFEAVLTLIEFPTVRGPEYDAAHPPPADVASFKRLIKDFTPSEFQDLVQERNAEGHCGYALCPNPHRKLASQQFKFVYGAQGDFQVAKTEDLRKWCSQGCHRRAMYILVQLQEVIRTDIELLEEHASDDDKARSARDEAAREAKKGEDQGELARERGTPRREPTGNLMTLTIRERKVTTPAVAPAIQEEESHNTIEGHAIKFDGTDPKLQNLSIDSELLESDPISESEPEEPRQTSSTKRAKKFMKG